MECKRVFFVAQMSHSTPCAAPPRMPVASEDQTWVPLRNLIFLVVTVASVAGWESKKVEIEKYLKLDILHKEEEDKQKLLTTTT